MSGFVAADEKSVSFDPRPGWTRGPCSTFERGLHRGGDGVTTPNGDPPGAVNPTPGEPIPLAYLPAEHVREGRPVRVRIRGKPKNGHAVTPRFHA